MPISAEEASRRLKEAGNLTDFLEEVARQGGRIIGERTVNDYMRDTGPTTAPNEQTGPRSLRQQRGRLARSYLQTRGRLGDTGGSGESIVEIARLDDDGVVLRKGSKVPYARIHEFGGRIRIPITDAMKGFFWAKLYERHGAPPFPESDRYFGLALAAQQSGRTHFVVQMPTRPSLRPGAQDARGDIAANARRELANHVDESLR